MRISDWSSDVCSSDLSVRRRMSSPFEKGSLLRDAPVIARSDCAQAKWSMARREAHANKKPAACRNTGGLIVELRCVSARSEEHTSELQSLMRISYDVFCLQKK